MTRRIFSGSSQYTGPAASRLLHSGPGKVYAIIATNNSTTTAGVNLRDGTTVAGAIILNIQVTAPQPVVIHFPQNSPLAFSDGLFIETGAGVRCFVITVAQE